MSDPDFVEGCEVLAEELEKAGRPELAALCDKAAYWLEGGDGLDLISLSELVEGCRDTLKQAVASESARGFADRTLEEIVGNLRSVEESARRLATEDGDLIEMAARLQAVAVLTSHILGGDL